MSDTYGKLFKIYLEPYTARGGSFHTNQTAQAIGKAIDQFGSLCGEADRLMTRLAGGECPNAADFKADAESVLRQLKAQAQTLAQLFETAKTNDRAKVSNMAVLSQRAGLAAARQQQDADASLRASLDGLVMQVQSDFAQAAPPSPPPPPPSPPLPPPNGNGALPRLDAEQLKAKLEGRAAKGPDAVSEEIDRISGQASEGFTLKG